VAPHTPGSNTTYSWTRRDLNAARKTEKPIILYIYDHEEKNNTFARQVERQLFPAEEVKKAFADFVYVMVRKDDKGWPIEILAKSDRGAALFVMTCDCTPVGSWARAGGSAPTLKQVAAAAEAAKAGNQAALDKMKRVPPKEFKQPEITRKVPVDKEEEKAPVQAPITIPGLNNEGAEKTGATKKTEPAKTVPVLTDE